VNCDAATRDVSTFNEKRERSIFRSTAGTYPIGLAAPVDLKVDRSLSIVVWRDATPRRRIAPNLG